MDRFATPSECRQHAVHCRTRADTPTGERVRALWISMARMWTKLATHCERLQRLNAQGAYSDTPTETQVASCPSVRPLQSANESAHPHPRPQERRRITLAHQSQCQPACGRLAWSGKAVERWRQAVAGRSCVRLAEIRYRL